MDINLTAILVLIGFVVPGLWAQRSRHLIAPKALDQIGATEELAQFVGAGLLIHLFLAAFCLLFFSRWCRGYAHDLNVDLRSGGLGQVILKHPWFTLCYLATSLLVGHFLGMVGGLVAVRQPIRRFLSRRLARLRISLLIDRPLVFEVFHQERFSGITFLELEMKERAGFYTGQLAWYALVRDEEPHKPVYLERVFRRQDQSENYQPMDVDGIWFDLADALSVRIVRVSEETLVKIVENKAPDQG